MIETTRTLVLTGGRDVTAAAGQAGNKEELYLGRLSFHCKRVEESRTDVVDTSPEVTYEERVHFVAAGAAGEIRFASVEAAEFFGEALMAFCQELSEKR